MWRFPGLLLVAAARWLAPARALGQPSLMADADFGACVTEPEGTCVCARSPDSVDGC